MIPKYKIGQFVCFKCRPVKDAMLTPLGIMYSPADELKWGVFQVKKYKRLPHTGISYKTTLVPVGESINYFLSQDYYTSDIIDKVTEEYIFDDMSLAEKFVKEFLNF